MISPGNKVFWGTNMTISSSVDASNFVADRPQSFKLDGYRLEIKAGDTLEDIVNTINTANIDVEANMLGGSFLSLTTKNPHQIWMQDIEGSSVLSDLGLVSTTNPSQPNEYSQTAQVSGLNIFDAIIQLRNDIYEGKQLEVGGRDLGYLDSSLNNLISHRADVGAKYNRIENHEKNLAWSKTYTQELITNTESTDLAESVMNLKWLESVHNYALNIGARLSQLQLLDFLR